MKLGIMQPYFFPYLGYFALMKYTEKWVVFDEVQFIRHGWIERNRVIKPGGGWQYISVPLVKHSRETLIKDIKIRVEDDWIDKLFRQLDHYRKIAPYYKTTSEFLRDALSFKTDSITSLNTHLLIKTCDYLNIPVDLSVFSEMNLTIDPVKEPGDWALNISKAMGADYYINPPGGIELFDRNRFMKEEINLQFLKINLRKYDQHMTVFEQGLSIIDVMMFNSPEEIFKMLDNYEII